ncbi:hypothetical protein, partial [Vibrio owensii]|uniref:hypothetical protein n=1 Tax=Vibrio owensii TaxID=696485 RepID=UPI001A7E6A84
IVSSAASDVYKRQEQALEGKQVKFCGIERVRQQSNQQDDEQTLFEDVSQIEALNPHSLLEQAFANNKDCLLYTSPSPRDD